MSQNSRMSVFKNKGKGITELRAKRVEVSVELRKARREEQQYKRRNVTGIRDGETTVSGNVFEIAKEDLVIAETSNVPDSSIPTVILSHIIEGLDNENPQTQLYACREARKLLSRERTPPIEVVIAAGLVYRLVNCLNCFACPEIQFEACWALTNIASGNTIQTMEVVKAGAIPLLVDLITLPITNLVEQAIWTLGNIAGDGPMLRDMVLEANILPRILSMNSGELPISYLKNMVWTLSNLCRNKNPSPCFELLRPALNMLCHLLLVEDRQIQADACWSLSYLTDGSNEKIQAVLDAGIAAPLVKLLDSNDGYIVVPALRAVGNIVTGNDSQTQIVIDAGVLPLLGKLMHHNYVNFAKEAAWAVSNITAGNLDQIKSVISSGILEDLLYLIDKGHYRAKKEAAWAITNLTSGGTISQVASVIEMGFVIPLCKLLEFGDWKIVAVVLDALNNILMAAERLNEVGHVCALIEECGGLHKLELLLHHRNMEIYNKTVQIIDGYFQEEEQQDENIDPAIAGQLALLDQLAFSVSDNQSFDF